MEKKQNVPALRFQGFSGEWERKSLGDIVEIVMGQSPDGSNYFNKPCGKILVQGNADIKDGWVVPRIWTTQITKVAEAGDLIMSVRAPAGEMGRTAYDVVLGRGVAAIKGNDFIYYLLVNLNQKGYWKNFAAGSTFESLNADNIRQAVVGITSLMEQNEIGGFFENIDREISSVQRKIRKFQQFRQAMLTKLFPREGAAEPELRFRGFSGAWKKRKVKDILIERNEQAPKSEEYPLKAFIANEGIVDKGKRYDRSALVTDTEAKLYKKTQYGDFIYSSNNLETGSIGLNKYGNASISPVYSIFYPTELGVSDFIGYRLVRKDFIREMVKWRQGVIYGQWRIPESDFLNIDILVPSIEEQRKIGSFFRELDDFISLQQKKLERMQRLKAALLEKLFV